MKDQNVLKIANTLEAFKTNLKSLHFSSPSLSIHKSVTDEFDDELLEFDDNLLENFQGVVNDFIYPDELKATEDYETAYDFESYLVNLRGFVISIKRKYNDELLYSGVVNILDDFCQVINRYLYLIRVATHQAAKKD